MRKMMAVGAFVLFLGTADTAGALQRPSPMKGASAAGQQGTVRVSFYSDKMNGKVTASGEKFSNGEMTAAHRTHRFGTLLRLTNPQNGKSVVVRVNDRGPFVKGRAVSITRKAAEELGIAESGTARVVMAVEKKAQ